MRHILLTSLIIVLLAASDSGAAYAQNVGKVTGFPLPRFVSMKSSVGNVRRGPGFGYRIDWVFNHENTPLLITGEHNLWRRVQDVDGQGGWMHFRLLSGVRTVVFRKSGTAIRNQPDVDGLVVAFADKGVIAWLKECTLLWCRVSVDSHTGWVEKPEIFGVFADEIVN